jgi:hypothetical protein
MNDDGPTYREKLAISWMLFWRGTLMGVALSLIWGFLVLLAWRWIDAPPNVIRLISGVGSYVLSVLIIGPLLVFMLLRKSFNGFRFDIVREKS